MDNISNRRSPGATSVHSRKYQSILHESMKKGIPSMFGVGFPRETTEVPSDEDDKNQFRKRAKRLAPTTYITVAPTDFRSVVQELTGLHKKTKVSDDELLQPEDKGGSIYVDSSDRKVEAAVSAAVEYPERVGEPLCVFYSRTGTCRFGASCKFDHLKNDQQLISETFSVTQKEPTFPERPGVPDCQYYLRTGYCKFGSSCRYHHPGNRIKPRSNFSPIRLPLHPEQIPQIQPQKLPELFAPGTTETRVLSRSSFLAFKGVERLEQERSQSKSDHRHHPRLLAIETLQNQAHDVHVNAPLSSLPATGFRAEYFVELKFTGCTLYERAWQGRQRIGSLRVIDFSNSNLNNLPDLSEAQQARSLILRGCKNLENVSCIQYLARLEHLNLEGCTKLTGLPSVMHLKLLSSIDLSHCRNLKRLPPSIGCLSSLTSLNLKNCKRLEILPLSTLRMESLQSLDISGCSNLIKRATTASQSAAGASSSCGANPRKVPCLEGTHFGFQPRIEEQMSPVRMELGQTSATKQLKQSKQKEKPVEEMVFPQTHPTKAATNSRPGESSLERESSAATLISCHDPQEQTPMLEFYMHMSVEAIHLADVFGDIGDLVDARFHRTSSLQKDNLRDIMCFLEELKGSIPRTVACMRSTETYRTSLQDRLAHFGASFVEAQGECLALDAKLTMLSDEEANLDADIEALIARREKRSWS